MQPEQHGRKGLDTIKKTGQGLHMVQSIDEQLQFHREDMSCSNTEAC